MDNGKILLTNIQRFSIHDGPGIRTTVFLKGCNLRCPWCANPENLYSHPQPYIKDGIKGTYGKQKTPEEIFREVIKDKIFYEDGGGVTFSGGECLVQQEELLSLWQMLKDDGIHIAIETALFVPDISIALEFVDLFIIDVKILDEEKCKIVEHGNLSNYLKNISNVLSSGKPIIFRIPVIGGYTDDIHNQDLVAEFIKKCIDEAQNWQIQRVELIKEHNLGLSKYRSLHAVDDSFPIPDYKGVNDQTMQEYKDRIVKAINGCLDVEICKI